MDFTTRNWFNYVNQNIRLDEGIKDLGLSEQVITYIESALHDAPDSAKTWMGHRWKSTHLHQFVRPSNRIQEFRFNTMEPLLSDRSRNGGSRHQANREFSGSRETR